MVDKLTLPAKENAVQLKINDIIDNTTLESLKNVTITSPSAGQNLTYDATNQVWTNTSTSATIAWGDITGTLGDQTDLKNALDGKVDKVTSTSSKNRFYVITPAGAQSTLEGEQTGQTAATIPIRTSTGTIRTATPSHDNDAATKKYVDDSIPVVFTGADGTNAGTAGLVKAPAATDNTKFLKGDGTWSDVPSELPSQTSQSGKFLTTNGTTASWANVPSPNDATLTIQLNGTTVETFSANASTNKTVNIQATQVVWRTYTTT